MTTLTRPAAENGGWWRALPSTSRVAVDVAASAARDDDLVAARARTHVEAFGELYERYADPIHRYVYNRLRDGAAAEDVTSQVFYKALRAIDRFKPGGPPFRVWLYRIAANTIADHLRTRRVSASLEELGELADRGHPVADQVIDRAEAARIWQAIASLNDAQRTAVTLKLGQDMHTAEIALVMGRSEGAVKLLIHRGLAAIRNRLGTERQLGQNP